jgi:hypothetical protein
MPTENATKFRLRVPFIYKPLTRPAAAHPFPASTSWMSSDHPKTLFLDTIRAHHPKLLPVELQFFLPQSQVIPVGERINFRLALKAHESYLAPLLNTNSAPVLSSFLPLPSLSPPPVRTPCDVASESVQSLKSTRQPRFALKLTDGGVKSPVQVRLERRIAVDARQTGVVVLGWTSRGRGFTAVEVLAEGLLERVEREDGRVKWWGSLDLPDNVNCAGFSADRLSVQVSCSLYST